MWALISTQVTSGKEREESNWRSTLNEFLMLVNWRANTPAIPHGLAGKLISQSYLFCYFVLGVAFSQLKPLKGFS